MKILVEIDKSKYRWFVELLTNLKFVKSISEVKTNEIENNAGSKQLYDDLEHAIEEVNLAKEGKIKLKSAKEILDEI